MKKLIKNAAAGQLFNQIYFDIGFISARVVHVKNKIVSRM
jgi:hypothetical protein